MDLQNIVISLEYYRKILTECIFAIYQTIETILQRISNSFKTIDTDLTKYNEVVNPLCDAFNNEFIPMIELFRQVPTLPDDGKRKKSDTHASGTPHSPPENKSNWVTHINKKKIRIQYY